MLSPIKITSQTFCYESHLLYDQLTYSTSKVHKSNSTKRITMDTNFMITCSWDHAIGYIILILWDIMVPLLRITIATSLHQMCLNPWGYMITLGSYPSQSLLLILQHAQYPLNVESLYSIVAWWIMTIDSLASWFTIGSILCIPYTLVKSPW